MEKKDDPFPSLVDESALAKQADSFAELFEQRHCVVCGDFFTAKKMYNTEVCSKTECCKDLKRSYYRQKMRLRRNANAEKLVCQVIGCGFNLTIDKHHEGGRIYVLCPNHHALISRGIKKIEDYQLNVEF